MRVPGLALIMALCVVGTAQAQTGEWRFQWQQGQVLNYRVEHSTDVAETVGGKMTRTMAKVDLVKRWEVLSVDSEGTATIRLSITAMRNEQTRPNGEKLLFDSQALDKSTPELREQMSKFIGQPVAVLRVDRHGKAIEVKQGVASRFEAEPPFALTLPTSQVQAGQSWNRTYNITLDPPHGTGEKHPAQQQYNCTKVDGGLATFSLSTALSKTPATKADELPLLQKMPNGEIVFDLQRGRLQSVRFVIDREIQGHQGEGSVYIFRSNYAESIAN